MFAYDSDPTKYHFSGGANVIKILIKSSAKFQPYVYSFRRLLEDHKEFNLFQSLYYIPKASNDEFLIEKSPNYAEGLLQEDIKHRLHVIKARGGHGDIHPQDKYLTAGNLGAHPWIRKKYQMLKYLYLFVIQ